MQSKVQEATILVVDDEPDVADIYQQYLKDSYDVRVGYSGEEALEKIDDSVDVVLLDRRMPGLSGDEVLRQIRDQGFDCRVIVASAVDPDDQGTIPADDYLEKPLFKAELYDAIESQITRN